MIDLSNYNSKEVMKLIFSRQHEQISANVGTWRFMQESYLGGQAYINENNLWQYTKESTLDYKCRLKRSVFINHYEPLINQLTGILFNTEPIRTIPERLKYIEKNICGGKGLNVYMQTLVTNIMQYPMFILVDSPNIEGVKTEAERQAKGINPYCVNYFPWQVRDFSVNDKGEFDWIILDNTYVDKSNPFTKAATITTYRLWTPEVYIDYTKTAKEIIASEPVQHKRGVVPVVVANSRDVNFDQLNDSLFEDVAILNRDVYNKMSMLDENLMAGTIKVLTFPVSTMSPNNPDLPQDIMENGLQGLAVLPYVGTFAPPSFIGPNIGDTTYFINTIELDIRQIFSKIGMNEDREKTFQQSGSAKLLEFRKTEMFLNQVARNLEDTERKIIKLLGKWENMDIKDEDIEIQYNTSIEQEDVDVQLNRLFQAATLPFGSVTKAAYKRIVKHTLPDADEDEQKEMEEEIEKMQEASLDNKSIIDKATEEEETEDTTITEEKG